MEGTEEPVLGARSRATAPRSATGRAGRDRRCCWCTAVSRPHPLGGPATVAVDTVAPAFADARVAVLEGQGHVADLFAPELVAETLIDYLRERQPL